jgi:hypothetical protein
VSRIRLAQADLVGQAGPPVNPLAGTPALPLENVVMAVAYDQGDNQAHGVHSRYASAPLPWQLHLCSSDDVRRDSRCTRANHAFRMQFPCYALRGISFFCRCLVTSAVCAASPHCGKAPFRSFIAIYLSSHTSVNIGRGSCCKLLQALAIALAQLSEHDRRTTKRSRYKFIPSARMALQLLNVAYPNASLAAAVVVSGDGSGVSSGAGNGGSGEYSGPLPVSAAPHPSVAGAVIVTLSHAVGDARVMNPNTALPMVPPTHG